jgi:hypothetical protein
MATSLVPAGCPNQGPVTIVGVRPITAACTGGRGGRPAPRCHWVGDHGREIMRVSIWVMTSLTRRVEVLMAWLVMMAHEISFGWSWGTVNVSRPAARHA